MEKEPMAKLKIVMMNIFFMFNILYTSTYASDHPFGEKDSMKNYLQAIRYYVDFFSEEANPISDMYIEDSKLYSEIENIFNDLPPHRDVEKIRARTDQQGKEFLSWISRDSNKREKFKGILESVKTPTEQNYIKHLSNCVQNRNVSVASIILKNHNENIKNSSENYLYESGKGGLSYNVVFEVFFSLFKEYFAPEDRILSPCKLLDDHEDLSGYVKNLWKKPLEEDHSFKELFEKLKNLNEDFVVTIEKGMNFNSQDIIQFSESFVEGVFSIDKDHKLYNILNNFKENKTSCSDFLKGISIIANDPGQFLNIKSFENCKDIGQIHVSGGEVLTLLQKMEENFGAIVNQKPAKGKRLNKEQQQQQMQPIKNQIRKIETLLSGDLYRRFCSEQKGIIKLLEEIQSIKDKITDDVSIGEVLYRVHSKWHPCTVCMMSFMLLQDHLSKELGVPFKVSVSYNEDYILNAKCQGCIRNINAEIKEKSGIDFDGPGTKFDSSAIVCQQCQVNLYPSSSDDSFDGKTDLSTSTDEMEMEMEIKIDRSLKGKKRLSSQTQNIDFLPPLSIKRSSSYGYDQGNAPITPPRTQNLLPSRIFSGNSYFMPKSNRLVIKTCPVLGLPEKIILHMEVGNLAGDMNGVDIH
jgi:hypothetical protein